MYFRTFFFLFFIFGSTIFFLSSFKPEITLALCGAMCYEEESLNYIQLTAMISSTITLTLFIISNHYAQKNILKAKEKMASDRLNIEQIHAELEALKS